MCAYLSSPSAQTFLRDAFAHASFWLGLGLWAIGFAGNIIQDEFLLNLRRDMERSFKAADHDNDDTNNGKTKSMQEHYAIPHGPLYCLILHLNYLCEWAE